MRAIASDGYKPVAPEAGDPGPAPMLQWLPIDQLVVDDAYQRPIAEQGKRNVQRIADGFRWPKFAAVVVAPVEGGRYAVIDGQHRATAAHLRGLSQVPCMIVPVDRRGQAEAFGAINGGVTKLSAVQLHRAAVAAGEPAALAIEACCKQAGVVISHSANIVAMRAYGRGADRTCSVRAIAKQIEAVGTQTTALAMTAIVLASPGGSLLSGLVIETVCAVLARAEDWPAHRLRDAIAEIDLEQMLEASRVEAIRRRVPTALPLRTALDRRLDTALGRPA